VSDSTPLVTIVTPSLDQASFLESAIASVRDQDYPRLEHIVVDGGSTDGSLEIIKRHPELRWVSEADRGQADAVNKGFAMARGEIFGWLNADDLYLPGAVTAAVEALSATGAGLVYGGWLQIDEGGAVLRDVPARVWDHGTLRAGQNTIAQPAAFFTREAFEAVGGLDARYHYAMDYDLWLKIAARFEVRALERTLAAFRYHGDSKTVSEADRFWPETRRISRRHGGAFLSQPYLDRMADRRPWLFRLVTAARLLQARDFRGLLRRIVGTAPRRGS
jgi:glycosyltransferase involved in cell wall biosynthesis